MYSRFHFVFGFLIALTICVAGWTAAAQAPAASPAPPPATLRGHIADPTGALIPGAQITVTTAQGAPVAKVQADAAGGYVVHNLAPGSYVIQVEFQGFATFVSAPIPLEAGQVKNVNVKMAVEQAQQQVEVTAEGAPTVNTEAGGNASAIVIKGKDLDALSDDPDELQNELTALAGPSAGPNGGQIYIDGFTGGQLPPKSAIREIRINQNPFSAEFDRLGYGRIEILTKPGTDQLHGRFFAMGNDDAFNTGNPFTKTIPPYHSIMTNGTLSGSLSKSASFFISVEDRNTQDATIYTAATAIQDPASGIWYVPTQTTGNVVNIVPVSGGLFAPQMRTEVSPRLDFQLGQKNTVTLRYQFWRNHQTGSIGNTSLPTQNSTSNSVEHTFQLSDSEIISDRIVNEIRLEYRRGITSQVPVSTAPTVNVPSYFSAGGNGSQSSSGHSDHFELQEFVTMTAGAHAIKFGAWMRDDRQATSTSSNFNGAFDFATPYDYAGALNKEATGTACPAPPSPGVTCGSVNAPIKLTYTTGPVGNPYAFAGNVYNNALFFQDDWKYNRFLTLSGGLRWETQNHVADHSDFAPRFAFAYALDGHKNQKQAKTVLRGGFGFFYDRFGVGNLINLEQYNGTGKSQTQTVISNPTCFDATSLQNALSQGCASSGASAATVAPQIYAVSPSYRSPYAEQAGVSIERQLTKAATLTLTYLHSFGVHQLTVRDANPYAYEPGTDYFYNSTTGPRLNPNQGIVDQYFPEATYKQNQIIVNVNAQFTRNFGMVGFYNWTAANSDGGGGSNPSNSYNLKQDWGRAAFVRPQTIFLMGNYDAPWGLTFSPFLLARAGGPYSITTATDLTGDNFFNDRVASASSGDCGASTGVTAYASTTYGCLNTDPDSNVGLIAPDTLTGPASVAFNLRLSRSIGLGPSVESSGGPPPGGPHGGPHGRGPGFGGPFGGGGGGPFHGGMSNTGHKYSLTFSVQALNLFNDVNYGTPSGTVVPTFDQATGITGPGSRFEQSTRLASGMFSSPSSSASRRVFVQAFFSF